MWTPSMRSPAPGYHTPEDITGIADRITAVLLDACAALAADEPTTPFGARLEAHREWAHDHPAPPAALHKALAFWSRLHGVLSLALAGQFNGMGLDPALFFAAELDGLLAAGA
ncbi:WHG domain-containing protein [Streptomyces sp. A1-5]|nr:WHG domain-containing protein [Streptomyces noursei]UJB46904.1 WHG domain-containing protein [Streptomyces sp. A1-5]